MDNSEEEGEIQESQQIEIIQELSQESEEEEQLTHEEIWDDSALIDAWDSALLQYQQYHNSNDIKQTSYKRKAPEDRTSEDGTSEETKKSKDARMDRKESVKSVEKLPSNITKATLNNNSTEADALDTNALDTTASDAQMNAYMAWYWAGYYTAKSEKQ